MPMGLQFNIKYVIKRGGLDSEFSGPNAETVTFMLCEVTINDMLQDVRLPERR